MRKIKNIKKLAKVNDEKAREELCRIVIRDFSKAKREFVATCCGPDKEFWLYKDAVTKLSTTFKGFAKELILTDCSWQNQLFEVIAEGRMRVEDIILYLMACSVIPDEAQSVLNEDHDFEKMFSVAYGWQVFLCKHGMHEMFVADDKYNWHITFSVFNNIPEIC